MSEKNQDDASAEPLTLYLHVPKTAGTTLAEQILSVVHARPGVEGRWVHDGVFFHPAEFELEKWEDPRPDPQIVATLRREDLTAVSGHFHFGLHRYVDRPCRYITLLREPVERMLSLHGHMQRHHGLRAGLEEFVRDPPLLEADNGQTRRLAGRWRPVGACSRDLLEVALHNLEQIVVGGITARFDESVLLMGNELGWTQLPELYYPKNVEPHRQESTDLPEELRDLILERNRFDASLFETASQQFEAELQAQNENFRRALARFQRHKRRFVEGLEGAARSYPAAIEARTRGRPP